MYIWRYLFKNLDVYGFVYGKNWVILHDTAWFCMPVEWRTHIALSTICQESNGINIIIQYVKSSYNQSSLVATVLHIKVWFHPQHQATQREAGNSLTCRSPINRNILMSSLLPFTLVASQCEKLTLTDSWMEDKWFNLRSHPTISRNGFRFHDSFMWFHDATTSVNFKFSKHFLVNWPQAWANDAALAPKAPDATAEIHGASQAQSDRWGRLNHRNCLWLKGTAKFTRWFTNAKNAMVEHGRT